MFFLFLYIDSVEYKYEESYNNGVSRFSIGENVNPEFLHLYIPILMKTIFFNVVYE